MRLICRSIWTKRINLAFAFLILMLIFLIFGCSVDPNIAVNHKAQVHIFDQNLNITQQYAVTEQISTKSLRTQPLELSSSIYHSFILLKIQNSGEKLKKVMIKITIEQREWEIEFRRMENFFEIKYDFSHETELIIPLEGVFFDILLDRMELNITLEYYPSVSGINALFHIIDAKIRHIISIDSLDVQILPSMFYFNFPNVESFSEIHRMYLETYFITNLTENTKLSLIVRLNSDVSIESLELVGVTLYKGNSSEFTIHIDKNVTKVGLRIKLNDYPNTRSFSSFSSNTNHFVQLEVISAEKLIHPSLFALDSYQIPDHPIPAEIMIIVMPVVLFGVPLLVIYRQRDRQIGVKIRKIE